MGLNINKSNIINLMGQILESSRAHRFGGFASLVQNINYPVGITGNYHGITWAALVWILPIFMWTSFAAQWNN